MYNIRIMDGIRRLSEGLTRATPWIVALAAVVAFACPAAFLWERALAAKLTLAFIMLTMGMTLTADDFRAIAQRPWEIALGAAGQFTLMPLIAFALVHVLPAGYAGVAVGLVLVGCCPGGVSSNLMSYICRGDVAFSVGMTTVSTLLAPALTPVLTASLVAAANLGDVEVKVDGYGMLLDLLLLGGDPCQDILDVCKAGIFVCTVYRDFQGLSLGSVQSHDLQNVVAGSFVSVAFKSSDTLEFYTCLCKKCGRTGMNAQSAFDNIIKCFHFLMILLIF